MYVSNTMKLCDVCENDPNPDVYHCHSCEMTVCKHLINWEKNSCGVEQPGKKCTGCKMMEEFE